MKKIMKKREHDDRENYLKKSFENAILKIALIRVNQNIWRNQHAFLAYNQLWFRRWKKKFTLKLDYVQ